MPLNKNIKKVLVIGFRIGGDRWATVYQCLFGRFPAHLGHGNRSMLTPSGRTF